MPRLFTPPFLRVAINSLTGLSVTPGQDQLIVLHSPGGNDLVISLHTSAKEDRIGELVGVLCNQYARLKNSDLPVTVSKGFACSLGGKKRYINVQVSADVQDATFKKDGSNITYLLPSNYALLENGSNKN